MASILENQEYPQGAEVILPPLVSDHFEAIRKMLVSYALDPEALVHCQEALRELEEIYKNIKYFGPMTTLETGQVFRWKVHVRGLAPRCLLRQTWANPIAPSLGTYWIRETYPSSKSASPCHSRLLRRCRNTSTHSLVHAQFPRICLARNKS